MTGWNDSKLLNLKFIFWLVFGQNMKKPWYQTWIVAWMLRQLLWNINFRVIVSQFLPCSESLFFSHPIPHTQTYKHQNTLDGARPETGFAVVDGSKAIRASVRPSGMTADTATRNDLPVITVQHPGSLSAPPLPIGERCRGGILISVSIANCSKSIARSA